MSNARRRPALAAHWPMLLVLAPALALHLAAWLAVSPGWFFFGDSIDYLGAVVNWHPWPRGFVPGAWRPSGYSLLLLWPLHFFRSLALVTLLQHLLTVVVALVVYAYATRCGVSRRFAALLTVPVLFDGYVLAFDQMYVSEPLFIPLVVGGLVLAAWPGGEQRRAASGGLLLGLSLITRTASAALLPLAAAYLAARRRSWRPAVALLLAGALPVLLYMADVKHARGSFALTTTTAVMTYGRATTFVDCAHFVPPDPDSAALCPDGRHDAQFYMFNADSPLARMPAAHHPNREAGRFSLAALEQQPGRFLAVVGRDALAALFGAGFAPDDYRWGVHHRTTAESGALGRAYQAGADPGPAYRAGLDAWLAGYQRWAWWPGWASGVVVLAGLAIALARRRRGALLDAGLFGLAALALFLVPILLVGADARYLVTVTPLAVLTLAAGLGRSEEEAPAPGGAGSSYSRSPARSRPPLRAAWPRRHREPGSER